MWKQEYSITKGRGVFLSPKTYIICDDDKQNGGGTKKALKGVHAQSKIEESAFINALHENKQTKIAESRLQNNRANKRCELITQEKNAVNTIYTKLRVENDQTTVRPLRKLDGTLI